MRSPRIILALALSLALLLATGCGGGSPSTASSAPAQNPALAFARCMRSHGFPGWPDPATGQRFDKSKLRALGYSVGRVRAAEQGACNHLLPESGGSQQTAQQTRARLEDELSFARCMRNRGVTRFPDPTAQSEITVEMVRAAGVDLHSPAVAQDAYACLPASHGALTRANVARAVSGQG